MVDIWLSGPSLSHDASRHQQPRLKRTVDFTIHREVEDAPPIYLKVRLRRLRYVSSCEAEYECDKEAIRKVVFERLELLDGTSEDYELIDLLGELLFELMFRD